MEGNNIQTLIVKNAQAGEKKGNGTNYCKL